MKLIAISVILLVLISVFALSQDAVKGHREFQGTYQIYSGDKQIQTDHIVVLLGEKAVDQLKAVGSSEEIRIEVKYESGIAQSYRKTINGLPGYSLSLEKDVISFREQESMIGALPVESTAQLIIFDPMAVSGYLFVLAEYNTDAGGKQSISVVVPSLQDYCQIDVERHGSDQFSSRGKSISAAHYRFGVGKKEIINVWTDGGRIVGIYQANKNLYVVDVEYDHLQEQIKKIVNRVM